MTAPSNKPHCLYLCFNFQQSVPYFVGSSLIQKEKVRISCRSEASRSRFSDFGFSVTSSNAEVVRTCSIVWIAVKPNKVNEVLRQVVEDLISTEGVEKTINIVNQKTLFISVAAGKEQHLWLICMSNRYAG